MMIITVWKNYFLLESLFTKLFNSIRCMMRSMIIQMLQTFLGQMRLKIKQLLNFMLVSLTFYWTLIKIIVIAYILFSKMLPYLTFSICCCFGKCRHLQSHCHSSWQDGSYCKSQVTNLNLLRLSSFRERKCKKALFFF